MKSSSAAPTLKDAIALLENYSLPGDRDVHINAESFLTAVSILKALKAPPAAERTALKDLADDFQKWFLQVEAGSPMMGDKKREYFQMVKKLRDAASASEGTKSE